MFEFKQFTILQDRCAQKVSEVACIQGAWTNIPDTCKRVLDIGSGTGLLSLMLAQRFDVIIDAIEVDEETYTQGKENIASSPFKGKINCLLGNVKTFDFKSTYDFIISNPPFFEKQLQTEQNKANIAKHSSQLTLNDLLFVIHNLLHTDGQFSILFPYERKNELEVNCLKYNFYPMNYLILKHSAAHAPKVFIGIFSQQQQVIKEEELIIKSNGEYSERMNELVKDYYL